MVIFSGLLIQKILRVQKFEIVVLLRGVVQIVRGVLRLGIIVRRRAAIFRQTDIGVASGPIYRP